jgi:glycerate kinase
VEVLCDVDNPLCGEHGAARAFGPQKGATPGMVARLDAGLQHLGRLVQAQRGVDILALPGAGAAGGLAAGAVAFLDATLISGIETIMQVSGLEQALAGADWVITGEGCFDAQSLCGKVVSGVVRLARKRGVKVAVIAGSVNVPEATWRRFGVSAVFALRLLVMSVEESIAQAPRWLAERTGEFARRWLKP